MNTSTKAADILTNTTFENKVLVPKDGTEHRLTSTEYLVGGDFAKTKTLTATKIRYCKTLTRWEVVHMYYGTMQSAPIGYETIPFEHFMKKFPGSFWPLAVHDVHTTIYDDVSNRNKYMTLQKGIQGPDADGNVYILTKLTSK